MLKKIYSIVLKIFQTVFGIDFAKKFDTKLRFHRTLNLKNPTSLADKVSYLELHSKNPLVSTCTDKLAVRDYIKSKELSNILVPIIGNGGGYTSIDKIWLSSTKRLKKAEKDVCYKSFLVKFFLW